VYADLADFSPSAFETFLQTFALFAVLVLLSSIYLLAVHIHIIIFMLASYVSNIHTFAMKAVYKRAGTNDLWDGYFCGGLAVSTFN